MAATASSNQIISDRTPAPMATVPVSFKNFLREMRLKSIFSFLFSRWFTGSNGSVAMVFDLGTFVYLLEAYQPVSDLPIELLSVSELFVSCHPDRLVVRQFKIQKAVAQITLVNIIPTVHKDGKIRNTGNNCMIARPDPLVLPTGSIFRINVEFYFEMLYKSPEKPIKNNL